MSWQVDTAERERDLLGVVSNRTNKISKLPRGYHVGPGRKCALIKVWASWGSI